MLTNCICRWCRSISCEVQFCRLSCNYLMCKMLKSMLCRFIQDLHIKVIYNRILMTVKCILKQFITIKHVYLAFHAYCFNAEDTPGIKQYNCLRSSWTLVEKTDRAITINNKQLNFYLIIRTSFSIIYQLDLKAAI